jgi:nitrogen fixation/metabolism regulation signal transduction histidine kinase
MNEVVVGFEEILALIAGENIEMEVKLSREPIMAYLDAGQPELALRNLVKNATMQVPHDQANLRLIDAAVEATKRGGTLPGECLLMRGGRIC